MKNGLNIEIAKFIRSIKGKICWKVDIDPLCGIFMEFGKPYLKISEVRAFASKLPLTKDGFPRRTATTRGMYSLWIDLVKWRFSINDETIATTSSVRYHKSINLSARKVIFYLDGQYLTSISINPENGSTVLTFDLGAKFEIIKSLNKRNELYTLDKNNVYYTVFGDGTFQKYLNGKSYERRLLKLS